MRKIKAKFDNEFKRGTDNSLRGAYGETDFDKKTVRINKKKAKKRGKGEVLKTIVHEEGHIQHPKMHEKNVEKTMQREVKSMPKAMKQAFLDHYKH